MLTQKAFKKIMAYKGWHPYIKPGGTINFSKGSYMVILTFEEHTNFECWATMKNAQGILKQKKEVKRRWN